jgi:hypothetical protein
VKGAPEDSFDPEAAAQKLYDGMKGLGKSQNRLILI